jgi:hypothetical protein
MQQQVTCMEDFFLEVGAVTGNEKPVADLVAQQINLAERREFPAELWIGRVGAVRENEPNAVVLRRFLVFAEHANDSVAHVDSKTGKHAAHLGFQRRELFEDKCVRRLLFEFGGARFDRAGHGDSRMDDSIADLHATQSGWRFHVPKPRPLPYTL